MWARLQHYSTYPVFYAQAVCNAVGSWHWCYVVFYALTVCSAVDSWHWCKQLALAMLAYVSSDLTADCL